MRTLALVLLVVACSKSGKTAPSRDEELKTSVRHLTNAIKYGIEVPGPSALDEWRLKTEGECTLVIDLVGGTLKVDDRQLAATYLKLCNHDIQVAMLRMGADRAEAARKAQPDAPLLKECTDATVAVARDELATNKTADAESQAQEARLAKACPK